MNNVAQMRMVKNRPPQEPDFLRRQVDVYYQERVAPWGGGHIMIGQMPGKDAVRLLSNDYLCMARHPEVIEAQCRLLKGADPALLMAAVFLHGDNPQARFEQQMAQWMHAESAVLSQSGWAANTGLIQSIAGPEIPCYIDMFAHASLWEGIRSAQASAHAFRHNVPEHLDALLRRHGPGVVIVDSVYSTSGSVAPLCDIVDVVERHGAVIVVDEAHSLGTHGPEGRGLVVDLGLTSRVHFRTASLAKAFAGRAGIVTCSARIAEFLKYTANPAIFSSGLLPHELAGLEATLEVISRSDDRRRRLHRNADYLRSGLSALGYNLELSEAQILGLEAGPELATMTLRDALEARGVFGSVFCAPATPKNRSLIRFTVNSDLTLAELDHVIDVCAEIRDEVDMANWPSTRRRRRSPMADVSLAAVANA
ncbi:MAG: quorum-sensing autoinducer CAI-1 synthase [Gammaproteobacteria bacterium]|nr:quorum-sensing autoinducer CAI-1 synthase [Gammaproteobacteria bacterium]